MGIKVYRILVTLATPLIHLWMFYRRLKGKEDAARMRERYGKASLPRPSGPLIWIHAASVGESNAILPLINQLTSKHPNLTILLTTITITSARLIDAKLPERAFHHYAPIDTMPAVKRFLNHWKPDLSLFVESEIWPNLVSETRKRQCPVLVINGRMSDRSYQLWQRFPKLAKQVFSCLGLVLAQGEEDAAHFSALGAQQVEYIGNIKFDAAPLPADSKAMGGMVQLVGERPIWLASSTHPDEERKIAEAHRKIAEQVPGVLSVIVPRHATRGDEITESLRDAGFRVAQRSKDEPIDEETEIYLADTMGELGMFYRLSHVVFIGGSLVEKGGQNPLEPARLHCAILCGPHMFNFKEMMRTLREKQAIIEVDSTDALATHVAELLTQHDRQEALAQAADEVVAEQQGIMDEVEKKMEPYLQPLLEEDAS